MCLKFKYTGADETIGPLEDGIEATWRTGDIHTVYAPAIGYYLARKDTFRIIPPQAEDPIYPEKSVLLMAHTITEHDVVPGRDVIDVLLPHSSHFSVLVNGKKTTDYISVLGALSIIRQGTVNVKVGDTIQLVISGE